MSSDTKRKYEKNLTNTLGNTPPPIIRDENGKVVDRRAYDRWYSKHKRDYTNGETQAEKNARYERYSRDYWTKYCIDNELDPANWKAVRERVLLEKRIRKHKKRYWYRY